MKIIKWGSLFVVIILCGLVFFIQDRINLNAQTRYEIKLYNSFLKVAYLIKSFGINANRFPANKEELLKKYESYRSDLKNFEFIRNGDDLTIVYYYPEKKQYYRVNLHFIGDEIFETSSIEVTDNKIFSMKNTFIRDSKFWNLNLDKSKNKLEENKN